MDEIQVICKLTARPIAKIVWVTRAMFLKSHKSVVWNRSTSGTPYNVHAFWNLCAMKSRMEGVTVNKYFLQVNETINESYFLYIHNYFSKKKPVGRKSKRVTPLTAPVMSFHKWPSKCNTADLSQLPNHLIVYVAVHEPSPQHLMNHEHTNA